MQYGSQAWGSKTAKNGFRNENDVIDKFNSWENDEESRRWLIIMDYNLDEIEYVKAIKISGHKTDIQVQVTIKLKSAIDTENIQVKLVSNLKGFNQIDKRWVGKYVEMWHIPDDVAVLLRQYTGELTPTKTDLRDLRRMFVNEFSKEEQQSLLHFLQNNRMLIVSDVLRGRGKFTAEWMLVAQKLPQHSRWILRNINNVINYFGNGDIIITKRGNIKIGKITMQRKGGDAGRETAKMLQFKINPAELFDIES
ncbi:MAG: type II restriction endonuclease [Anaerolineaceae bacterium 4572_78]|nr:MAG: type II restriction endonuclease [Anaerolineaceae bacterium 4572_78]